MDLHPNPTPLRSGTLESEEEVVVVVMKEGRSTVLYGAACSLTLLLPHIEVIICWAQHKETVLCLHGCFLSF